jgi:hypothetical protein
MKTGENEWYVVINAGTKSVLLIGIYALEHKQ